MAFRKPFIRLVYKNFIGQVKIEDYNVFVSWKNFVIQILKVGCEIGDYL